MGAAFKFAIVLNALFGLLGWFILIKHPGVGFTIIILNWLIFAILMKRRKQKSRVKNIMIKQFYN